MRELPLATGQSTEAARTGSSAPPPGKVFAGRYSLVRPLGRGSMGSVWLADDERLKRKVALKILGSIWAESEDVRRRFEREALSVARLHSPHIVQVFDYGIEGNKPYIVMELMSGEDLQTRLKREKQLSVEETAAIVTHVCRGLHVAHKAGLVHRDLKPGNIMIDKSTGEELAKVLDFGVAKAAADVDVEGTKAGTLLGTPQYMAPEQARALPDIDHRADLWSLGVIAYRALTGRPPFRAKSVGDMIVQICTATPPKATELRPELPPLINVFFERALARDREKRFANAREFASSFHRVLGSSSMSMSISAMDTGRFAAVGEGSDACPMSDVQPLSASYSLQDSQPGLPRPAGRESFPGIGGSGVIPVTDTLPSGSEPGVGDSHRSGSYSATAVPLGDMTPPKRRGRLGLWAGAVVALVVAAAAFVGVRHFAAAPDAGAAAALPQPTAAPTTEVAAPLPTLATASAEPAASAAPAETAAASAEPAASASAAPPRPTTGRPPPATAAQPTATPPPVPTPPKKSDGDLLLERF